MRYSSSPTVVRGVTFKQYVLAVVPVFTPVSISTWNVSSSVVATVVRGPAEPIALVQPTKLVAPATRLARINSVVMVAAGSSIKLLLGREGGNTQVGAAVGDQTNGLAKGDKEDSSVGLLIGLLLGESEGTSIRLLLGVAAEGLCKGADNGPTAGENADGSRVELLLLGKEANGVTKGKKGGLHHRNAHVLLKGDEGVLHKTAHGLLDRDGDELAGGGETGGSSVELLLLSKNTDDVTDGEEGAAEGLLVGDAA